MRAINFFLTPLAVVSIVLLSTACTQTSDNNKQNHPGEQLNVVATTTIVGDVVNNIAGDAVHLDILLPTGSDPHNFQLTPQDVTLIADADLVFINGIGLEEFLDPASENAGSAEKVVNVSAGISLLQSGHHDGKDEEDVTFDPHVWMDPNNVLIWVENIEEALIDLDPKNTAIYRKNADNYTVSLTEVDQEIREKLAQISHSQRQLVTDHLVYGYFANRYGFNQIGTIIPGHSTMSEPSALELAELEDTIQEYNVTTIFVGNTVNPSLAKRIAQDTGTQLIFLFTGSLTEPGGPADNYLDFIRYNANVIINAIK